jgi:flavin reductase (DIM6/NTAB) family NADH-FMN oxidoreductase RutF
MHLDPEILAPGVFYSWMAHIVVPRPIAWVSTISQAGVTNLAPFSFFNAVSSRPPILVVCPANDRQGQPKDTMRNIEETGEFVVNVAPWRMLNAMNATSTPLPAAESEFERFEVASSPSSVVRPPRVSDVPAAFECRLERVVRFGEGPGGGNAVFGRIVWLFVRDDCLGPDGFPDARLVDPVARIGGDKFVRLGETAALERP